MKKYLLIVLVALSSCSGVEKPDNLIEEETMVDILYDLSVMEAMRSQNPNRLMKAPNLRTYIFEKYKIDSVQFAKSNAYYSSDPKEYQKLFQKVGDRLNENIKVEEKKSIPTIPSKREKDTIGQIN